jgi:hypothetical protein
LKTSNVKALDGNRYQVEIPPGDNAPFWLEFAMDLTPDQQEASFVPPQIEGNTGRHEYFVVDEPDDAQVAVNGEGLIAQIPAERLGEALSKALRQDRSLMSIPDNETLRLTIHWFQAMHTAAVVLDFLSLFTSFEENGNVLSVLVMDVPPEAEPRLKLKAVPDAEVWSLTVNGTKRDVFVGDQGSWLIPLERGNASHVELAFLRKGTKLGLQGKLDAVVPETGMPSRELRVGVALPARVELLFAEGPVNPAPGEGWQPPSEFVGKPYFFARSFYKGEGMTLSLSYKEPVNPVQHRQGETP